MDKIFVKGLKLFAYHGCNREEQVNGQFFVLDITCCLDLGEVCSNDDVKSSLNYAELVDAVSKVFCSEPSHTIERAAQEVADECLKKFPIIESIIIKVKKPNAPMKGDMRYVAVQLERHR